MITPNQFEWHRSDEDNADAACLHCGGCIQHEAWCSTQNINVRYAFQIAAHPEILSVQDDLILHALGVKWNSDLSPFVGAQLGSAVITAPGSREARS